MNIEQSLLL